jgi:hypothetical protein
MKGKKPTKKKHKPHPPPPPPHKKKKKKSSKTITPFPWLRLLSSHHQAQQHFEEGICPCTANQGVPLFELAL